MKKQIFFSLLFILLHFYLFAQPIAFSEKVPLVECLPSEVRIDLLTASALRPDHSILGRNFPLMGWPLGSALYEGLFLMNYFDQSNPFSTDGQFLDYNCGSVLGYDGHTGTDITVLNFRLMDEGMPILAASAGMVEKVRWDEFDRHYEPPYSSNIPNIVLIRHEDGSASLYVHLRTESVAVNEGEWVEKGQFLGYVGSSGSSPMPHLHIEFWEPGSIAYPNVTFRDPWEGSCHNEESLWEEQLAYVPDNDIWIMDAGITTEAGAGGNANALFSRPFKDRAPQPLVWGANEPYMIAWVQLQSPPGDNYRLDVLKPDGSVFRTSETITIPQYIRYSWHPFVWAIPPIAPSEFGLWKMRITTNGNLLKEIPFHVEQATYYAPRFYPLGGKSVRIEGAPHQEILEMWEYSESVNFHLINAPEYVSLSGNTISIDAPNNQPYRNAFFQAVATDEQGSTDTMWYHLVEPVKPLNPMATNTESHSLAPIASLLVLPNPAGEAAMVSVELMKNKETVLSLYNITGQSLGSRQLNGNGANKIEIPLLELSRGSLVPGLYFIQLQQEDRITVFPFVYH